MQVTVVSLWIIAAIVGGVSAQTCGPDGAIAIAGSSTVEPIARKWAEEYTKKCTGITVKVEAGGSSVGAQRVCNTLPTNPNLAAVDIGTMSRKWRTGASRTEATTTDNITHTCFIGDQTRKTVQIEVGVDAIAMVVRSGGLVAECLQKAPGLTVAQLRWMFTNVSETVQGLTTPALLSTVIPYYDGNEATKIWKELYINCPAVNIRIAGPDVLSGTHEFFREVVGMSTPFEGFSTKRQGGFFNSSNDEDVVNYVVTTGTGDAIAFVDMVTFFNNGALLQGIPIKNIAGEEFIAPTKASIETEAYSPLARPLYMQVLLTDSALSNTKPFMTWGLSNFGAQLVYATRSVPLPLNKRIVMLARLGLPPPNDSIDTVAPVRFPTRPPTKAPIVISVPTKAPLVPTKAPSKSPTKQPVKTPSTTPIRPLTRLPTRAPVGSPKRCGLLGISLFCKCGLIRRLLGLC